MANGYSQEWSKSNNTIGTSYIRLHYSTSYNAATNRSTVTVTPQLKQGSNAGSYSFFDGTGSGNGGIYGNGDKLYALATTYGSSGELRGGSSNAWGDMYPSSGSISSFSIQHDSNGNASFTLGMYGTVHATYGPTNNGPIGSTAGNTITIHQDAPYSITYDANGGSGAPNSQSVYAGVSYQLSAAQPTRTGYIFKGWSTNSSATSADYQPEQTVTPNGNLALFAVWQKSTFTLSIQQGTGSIVSVIRQGTQLSDGAVITYGDVLTISVSPGIGYNIGELLVDGSSFVSGSTYTVTDNVSVESSATVKQFTLSVDEGTGTSVTVTRTYSPLGNAAAGVLADGDTIYHSDVLNIAVSAAPGYVLQTVEMNGGSIQSPYSVSGDIDITTTAIAAGAYINTGSAFFMYQFLIKGQQQWDLYRPVVFNGNSWENY